MNATEWKEKGNGHLKNKEYTEALKCYDEAILLEPNNHIHFSNRSACNFNMSNYTKALEDAEKAISIKSDYIKGYQRKASAQEKLSLVEESINTLKKALEIDPNNQDVKNSLSEMEASAKNPFTKNFPKLFTDPRTSRYMSDPQFMNLLNMAMKDQTMLMGLVSKDPRFMDVFSVLTGIDLGAMNEDVLKSKKEKEELEKERKKQEEENRIKSEAERKKKEEEDKVNSMSEEERLELANKKRAEELKNIGNEHYKKKDFDKAMEFYNEAIQIYPKELTLYLNRAGVYHEKKEYNKVIEDCSHVVENTFDFQKKGRAYGRMGFAYEQLEDWDNAIESFNKSLLENNDHRIKEALRNLQKKKEKIEAERYINPEIAEENNNKGNEFYKAGKYPEALNEYKEAIKRNPTLPKYYSNRASAYQKLMEFNLAAKDCEKALEIDSKYLKAYQKKATCHIMMKELHKALDTYEKALKIYPDDMELKQGYAKAIGQINSSSSAEEDQERAKHAYADPEIQRLLMDPRIQQFFKDLQENPKSANDAMMKDEFIANAAKRLMAAGIIKTK
jgi:stress-induced-phosphoprotein 1